MLMVNSTVVVITKTIVNFEAWDFKSQNTKQKVWRIFMAKILNLGIYTLINVEMATQTLIFRDDKFIEDYELKVKETKYNCREDLGSENMVKLLATEFVVQLLRPLAITLANYLFYGCLKGRLQWKPEFEIPDEIVWLLYFQAIIWLNVIVSPFTALLTPILLYIIFKYNYFSLRNLKGMQKQSSNANDTGYFIMIFLNLTFLFIVSCIVVFLTLPMTHENWAYDQETIVCGPFLSN